MFILIADNITTHNIIEAVPLLTLPTNCYLKKINPQSHHRQSLESRLTKTFDNFVSIRRISESSPPISHLKKRIELKNFFR